MNSLPFQLPDLNETLSPHAADSPSALHMIARRRSTPIKMMDPEGAAPTGELLQNILSSAMRVPDHRKIEPWRLIVIEGEARQKLGAELATRFAFLNPAANEDMLAEERNRLLHGPFLCAPLHLFHLRAEQREAVLRTCCVTGAARAED